MNCPHCSKPTKQYGLLDYCPRCQKWFKNGEEVDGVFDYCKTKDTNPEECNDFIQNQIILRGTIKKNGELLAKNPPGIDKISDADKICAACDKYDFVLDE